ncbi:HAD-IA family hydrolase [Candidatus Cyanaurora vandensis]|uniref:HAD-IA family hydrolase n=1 Tax=Candidatus Cyanaurora vandensis TaxID=2714958 RepID=UPI00257C76A7|nr:HAD-IA family hydrolase [Candidatus Cyanaurora vandensis]
MGVLVFDLMDTVVQDPFYEHIPRHLGVSFQTLLTQKHPTSWLEFERGQIDEAVFLQRFYQGERVLTDPLALKAAFFDYYEFLPGMEGLLLDLKKQGETLWVLSNYCRWFEDIRRKLDLDRYFAGYLISYECGFRKPEPQAYQALEARLGARDALTLIDDRLSNIEGAEQVGWRGILFRGADGLRTQLGV